MRQFSQIDNLKNVVNYQVCRSMGGKRMIKKLTKFGRSTLSVILCLTMLLTTFCFFDIGSVISNAMVIVTENNKMKGSLSSQFMYAPEIAYLKPGSSAF